MDCLGRTGNILCILYNSQAILLGDKCYRRSNNDIAEVGGKGQLKCVAQIQTFKNCNRHTPSDSFPWLQILMEKEGLSPAALPLCQWAVGRAQPPWEQRTNSFSSIMWKPCSCPTLTS